MVILVMFTIMTLWTNNSYNSIINWIVWAIFFIDFIVRFTVTKEKWTFLKRNPFLVVAIIPLDQFFQIARVVRLIYLFRIKTITKYYIQPLIDKLTYQSKILILMYVFVFLIIESLIIWIIEVDVKSFWKSIQYVFTHLRSFGHHPFEVTHTVTIWLFVLTGIIGILLHGIAIQWIFSKVESYYHRFRKKESPMNTDM